MVIANDNTVASGAWWPKHPREDRTRPRGRRSACVCRSIYLVDCSGLFLPRAEPFVFGARPGAGHIFTKNARIWRTQGVPQLAGVFGDCIAGGGYMPIISDRVVMTEGAYMVIAGAALIRGAKSLKLTSLDIGGPGGARAPESQCADLRVPDDATALKVLRDEVEEAFRASANALLPLRRAFPIDTAVRCDRTPARCSRRIRDRATQIEEVLARLVDDSAVPRVLCRGLGREMIAGVARS